MTPAQDDLFGGIAAPPQPLRAARPRATPHLVLPRDEAGRFLREDGIRRAREAESAEWFAQGLALLARYGQQLPAPREFLFEDFRAFALERGLVHPHTHHCWGILTRKAAKEGLIVATDRYAPAKSPKTHAHPVRVWRSLP